MADSKIILTSEKGKLDKRDVGMGTILAVVTTILVGVQQAGDAFFTQIFPFLNTVNPTVKSIVMAGIGAGIAYLIQKLREGQKVIVDPTDANVQAMIQTQGKDAQQESLSISTDTTKETITEPTADQK